jgi:hypothetical protein
MPSVDSNLSHDGNHGGLELVRQGMGHFGPTAVQHNGRGDVSRCNDHPHESGRTLDFFDCVRRVIRKPDSRHHVTALPESGQSGLIPGEAAGTGIGGNAGLPCCPADCRRDATAGIGMQS